MHLSSLQPLRSSSYKLLAFALLVLPCFAQQSPANGESVHMTVTLEPRRAKTIPPVEQQDLVVYENNQKRPVTGFTPAQGSLQLMLMIDNSANNTFNTEIPALKNFVNSLPPQTEVAVGYMQNGLTQLTKNFTHDHAAAANAIRVPYGFGGADVSPYDSLSYAIKHWPKNHAERREVLMISGGIEGLGGGFIPENPYVMAGIHDAQRAGVVVYSIWSPSVGHFGHDYWREIWGQNFLAEMSDATGGEMYLTTIGPPVSFDPFLHSIIDHLQHQYILTFDALPERKGLQPVRVAIPNKDASISFPTAVQVPAGE
jgi:hypothetical protein